MQGVDQNGDQIGTVFLPQEWNLLFHTARTQRPQVALQIDPH